MDEEYKDMHSFRHVLNKHFFKFFFGLLGMIAVGLFVAYGTHYYSSYKKFNEQVKKQDAAKAGADRLQKLYEADTRGGN